MDEFKAALRHNQFRTLFHYLCNIELTPEISNACLNDLEEHEREELKCFQKVPFHARMELVRDMYFAIGKYSQFSRAREKVYDSMNRRCCYEHYHFHHSEYERYNPNFLMYWLVSGEVKPEHLGFLDHTKAESNASQVFLFVRLVENKFLSLLFYLQYSKI